MTTARDVFKLKTLVLAAGQGQRLRPLTAATPKPLLPFLALPILSQTLRRLLQLRIAPTAIAVNSHYLLHELISYQKQCPIPFFLSQEPCILGTGGAVDFLREQHWLDSDDHLLIYNGDIVSDLDIDLLIARHRDSHAKATCVFIDHVAGTTPCLSKDGHLIQIGRQGNRTFAGVYILSPDIIRMIPKGSSDVISALKAALAQGDRIDELHHKGLWFDIGTPKAYAEAQLAVASDQKKFDSLELKKSLEFFNIPYSFKEGFFTATPHTGSRVRVQTPVVINGDFNMTSLNTVELSHSVIMPGARLDKPKVYRQICIDDICLGF